MNDNDYKEALFYAASIFNERLGAEFSEDNLVAGVSQSMRRRKNFSGTTLSHLPISETRRNPKNAF